MAIETKRVEYSTFEEQVQLDSIIKNMEAFGWQVLNTQDVYSKNQTIKSYDNITGTLRLENSTTDYTVVTYQRNTSMKHYAEIVELETEYWELDKQENQLWAAKHASENAQLSISSLFSALTIKNWIIAGILALIPPGFYMGILYLIGQMSKIKRQRKKALEDIDDCDFYEDDSHPINIVGAKKSDILEKAKKLVSMS